jgi:hypothetical protein
MIKSIDAESKNISQKGKNFSCKATGRAKNALKQAKNRQKNEITQVVTDGIKHKEDIRGKAQKQPPKREIPKKEAAADAK